MNRLLWTLLVLVLGGVILLWVASRLRPDLLPQSPRHGVLEDFGPLAPFQFTDQEGQVATLEDFKGRPWVASFIFTRCSGPCPMMTTEMAWLADTLDADVQLASFTVDPDYDTPAVLRTYAESFGAVHPRWRFLTGERGALARLSIDSFHLAMGEPENHPPASSLSDSAAAVALFDVAHSTRFVLVDGAARIRGYYDGLDRPALRRLRADALRLLKGSR